MAKKAKAAELTLSDAEIEAIVDMLIAYHDVGTSVEERMNAFLNDIKSTGADPYEVYGEFGEHIEDLFERSKGFPRKTDG
jgi:hypothetical protein